jgi:hypothetical protein
MLSILDPSCAWSQVRLSPNKLGLPQVQLALDPSMKRKETPFFREHQLWKTAKKKLGTEGPGNHSTSASNSAHSQHGTSVLEPGPPKMTGTQNTNHHVWLIQIIRVEDLFQVEDL